MLEEQLARVKPLLAEATKATGIVNARALVKTAPGMEDINAQGQDYEKATVLVRQAATELAAAKQLAADLAGAVAAKKQGDEAMVPAALTSALKDLGKEVETARAAPYSDQFAELYRTMDTALAEAQKLLQGKDQPTAGAQLKIVGDALVKARTGQSEHDRFKKAYDLLVLKQTEYTTSTAPPAAKLKDKTDPLVAALKTADEQDKAHDWNQAFKALNAAEIAAKSAKDAFDARTTYDADRKLTFDKANRLTDPATKNPILAMLTKADDAADAFNFAHAKRFLENAEARLEGESVKNLAKATPLNIGEIEAAVQKMLDAVGGDELLPSPTASPVKQRNAKSGTPQKTLNGPELLDEIVKGFDDTVPPEVIAAIAKKRFDIDLSVSSMSWGVVGGKDVLTDEVSNVAEQDDTKQFTERSKTARKLYDTLAMTPEQSDRNPSLKAVTRLSAYKIAMNDDGTVRDFEEESGGWYETNTNKTVMQGRPGRAAMKQKFGANIATELPPKPPQPWDQETAKKMKELEVYEPADDTEVDYFEFANVHETGHGVDDRLGFMASRLGNAAFGNWLNHGSNLAQVATPVAAHYAKVAKVPDMAGALTQFVADVMAGTDAPTPLVATDKQVGVNEACDKIKTEWYANAKESASPWWSQGKCDTITMDDGRIYQQAYSSTWVSYPAAERAKAVTGYQFRAPGEWFAELFSAYHHEKLKPGHPARKWLSSLQL